MKVGEIIKNYNLEVLSNKIKKDDQQIRIIFHFQNLYDELCGNISLKNRFFKIFNKNIESKFGIYLWGDVGRGKTYLINLFFNSLPLKNKMRLHFHSFMYKIHNELSIFSGVIDPLEVVAKKIASEYKIICLDEFYVSDIADAMLLGRLINKLISYKVYLVVSSNIHPDDLYKNGLQRQHFLKTIDLIKNKLLILSIDGSYDYRLMTLEKSDIYYDANVFDVNKKLFDVFMKLSSSEISKNGNIVILNRNINFMFLSDGIIWFDFYQLCSSPRSQYDYIEISKIYHTVFIINIPILHDIGEGEVRRFISLIDEFYDNNVKIVISTFCNLDKMYSHGSLYNEFKRTLSRLIEMKSHYYLSKKHLIK